MIGSYNGIAPRRMGTKRKEYVRNNFLITRRTRDYLSAWHSLENRGRSILELR